MGAILNALSARIAQFRPIEGLWTSKQYPKNRFRQSFCRKRRKRKRIRGQPWDWETKSLHILLASSYNQSSRADLSILFADLTYSSYKTVYNCWRNQRKTSCRASYHQQIDEDGLVTCALRALFSLAFSKQHGEARRISIDLISTKTKPLEKLLLPTSTSKH